MSDEAADRAAVRQEVKRGHQINAETQYPSWNKHTEKQLKELTTASKRRVYKSDSLEYHLLHSYFPELRTHGNVLDMKRAAKKKDKEKEQTGNQANSAATEAVGPPVPSGDGGIGGVSPIEEDMSVRVVASPSKPSPRKGVKARSASDDAPSKNDNDKEDRTDGAGKDRDDGAGNDNDDGAGKGNDDGDKDKDDVAVDGTEEESESGVAEKIKKKNRRTGKEDRDESERKRKAPKPRTTRRKVDVADSSESEQDVAETTKQRKTPARRLSSRPPDPTPVEHRDADDTKRQSRHYLNSDSQLLLTWNSFESLRHEFQKKLWARDGFLRKDGAPDRVLNVETLLLTAKELWSPKLHGNLKTEFASSRVDAKDQ